ncbi:uncharacterized protein LOC132222958 isoform X3 [Myotis daubentonii]|uniref:uncharacterized protein LOC132222958 isoform X3 n=1 Tax=Myotis daubentonii TaxID=98922 RepID=UPI0028738AE8|nr:uncharacterized protein LOC132222958 isoform X3 [Myotis daubentonii]
MAAAAVARGVQGAGAKGRGTAAHRSQCRSGGGAAPGACAEPRGRVLGGGLMPPSPKCRSGRGCGPAQAHRTAVGGLRGGLLRRLRPARRAATPIASLKPLPPAAAAQSREGGGRMQAGWRGLCHAAAPPRRTMRTARMRALCAGATPACAARLDEHPEERGRVDPTAFPVAAPPITLSPFQVWGSTRRHPWESGAVLGPRGVRA